jgi:segregation and condensation protein B
MPRLATHIEAILYLKGKPLSIADIAELAGCDKDAVTDALIELMADYAHRDSALEVLETPTGYSLQLRSAFHDLLQELVPAELGVGALRTLAAIALKNPIAQTELIELRGSGAYQHIQELIGLGFVQRRKQSDGRSYWLQVTDKFHQHFELDRLLPPLEKQALS